MLNQSECAPACDSHAYSGGHAAAIEHLLVCLDGSSSSDACLPYARFVGNAFGARVTLLHVIPSASELHDDSRADALAWELAKREANLYLGGAQRALGMASERTRVRLTQGHPAEQIIAAARELAADLTILSSHGDRGQGPLDPGSVTHHVLALATGSVLLVEPNCGVRTPPHRIMVPLDGSVRGESVLPIAADLARVNGAEVLLVHVVTDPTPTAVLSDPDDVQLALSLASRMETKAEAYLAQTRTRMLREVPLVQTLVVRRGDERQALVDVAAKHAVDMLVLTAHGATCNGGRVFGSVASYLLTHGRLPILVLQDMPQSSTELGPDTPRRGAFSARPPERV
jgi:nucleotide-binding universal stress UspA family protein